jgi:hypothetical protein
MNGLALLLSRRPFIYLKCGSSEFFLHSLIRSDFHVYSPAENQLGSFLRYDIHVLLTVLIIFKMTIFR